MRKLQRLALVSLAFIGSAWSQEAGKAKDPFSQRGEQPAFPVGTPRRKTDLPDLPPVVQRAPKGPDAIMKASAQDEQGESKVRRAFPDLRQNYKTVKPFTFDEETKRVPDIWVLDFQFRDPRYITVDIPGKGRQTVWYMTYKIVNRTGEPRSFVPQFTIVVETGKSPGKVVQDVILPSAERAVRMKEDPTVDLFDSVTIATKPIPPTPAKEALPIERNGVVFWEGVEGDDDNVKAFDLYVTGLSNGYTQIEDPKTKQIVLRRKTLRLKFAKPGDSTGAVRAKIEFTGDPTWLYR